FINALDIKENNKIVVLDKKISDVLFKDQSPVGKYVKVGELMFKVVGVNSKREQWGGSNAYIPFSTAQAVYNPDKKFNQITFTVDGLATKAENERFDESLRAVMGRSLNFNPQDKQALYVDNHQANYLETMKIFGG
ncbi:MAG TPA: hypothetical protein DDZ78_11065, partial [Porphyromonadaceae bacterium]|nr:hypothetical protein [Porphyromonadaceae bacterium]